MLMIRSRPLGILCIPLFLVFTLSTAGAADRCRFVRYPDIPVTMVHRQPLIPAKINGVEAHFIVDTGASFSILPPATVKRFKLPLTTAPFGDYLEGIGGVRIPKVATVRTFTFVTVPIDRVQFLVSGGGGGPDAVGTIGQNLLRAADDEFDFANGVMRFIKPEHCGSRELAYWDTTQPIGVVDLDSSSRARTELIGWGRVDGHRISVMFDTGSQRSVLSLAAARRVGISPGSPGVVPAGTIEGIGPHRVKAWLAPIRVLEIGGEQIERTHLLIGHIFGRDQHVDMLLGVDFFLSHRVYVARGQGKIYFTYNGGPVFDVTPTRPHPKKPPHAGPLVTPADAFRFADKGMAYAGRVRPGVGRFFARIGFDPRIR